jgi:hypothetical protein
LRSTRHPGGTVIFEELLTVMAVKVFGHLIVVGKLIGEDISPLLLDNWKTCSCASLRSKLHFFDGNTIFKVICPNSSSTEIHSENIT